MEGRSRITQGLWAGLALAMLIAARLLQWPLDARSSQLGIAPDESVARKNPQMTLWTVMPGVFRTFAVAYMWIGMEDDKQKGRYFDGQQKAEWISELQPHYPGVWTYMAWNMSYNISVGTHTPQERWNWVNRGVELLRDKGIPANPKSLALYHELSWILYHKIGGDTDEMNLSYKKHWAAKMQQVLGAPPMGPAERAVEAFRPIAEAPLDKGQVKPEIESIPAYPFFMGGFLALMLIVAMLLWRNRVVLLPVAGMLLVGGGIVVGLLAAGNVSFLMTRMTGGVRLPESGQFVQADQFDVLLKDGAVKAYAEDIGKLLRDPKRGGGDDVLRDGAMRAPFLEPLAEPTPDRPLMGFLTAWNRYSSDQEADVVRPKTLKAPDEQKIAAITDKEAREDALHARAIWLIMNDPARRPARDKLLAFERAQVLWNVWRMDPQFMLGLMENPNQIGSTGETGGIKYQAPLDWRNPTAHALYWATYGIQACQSIQRADIDALNCDRIALFSLRDMSFFGRLTMREKPGERDNPDIWRLPDIRFIGPAHKQHILFINAVSRARGDKFEENTFRDGHRNFIENAIQMLWLSNRRKEAEDYLKFLRDDYGMKGGKYDLPVKEFVMATLNEQGRPIASVASGQIALALETAFLGAASGDAATYEYYKAYAMAVYDLYQKNAVPRNKFSWTFDEEAATILHDLLVEPRIYGYNITLAARSRLYRAVAGDAQSPDIAKLLYDNAAPYLKEDCGDANVPFETYFPVPRDMDAWRAAHQTTSAPAR
ncbi:MAG: hypothetical protein ACE15C_11840 [Phycisphaerae bacterium]